MSALLLKANKNPGPAPKSTANILLWKFGSFPKVKV
jgi:hypothetical protein